MKYGIFDSRFTVSKDPVLFDEGNGRFVSAIFDDKEKAERMAAMMNAITSLTTYVVKEMKG